MKTILAGNENVAKILGKQRGKNVAYRLMNYVLQDDCDDGLLLLNTITGQLVLVDKEEAEVLSVLPTIRTEAMTPLIENYFLVPTEFDEKDTVDKLRLILKRMLAPEGIKGYTILTTTNCNARCF